MRRRTILGALTGCLAHSVSGRAARVGIHVVTHPGVGLSEALRADLAAIFLRKLVSWKGGMIAMPVDQSLRSPARAVFSDEVLGMSEMSVQAFWQKHLAAGGQEPPPVRASDEEVLAFVASTPGSVGYILATTVVPATVRTLAVKH